MRGGVERERERVIGTIVWSNMEHLFNGGCGKRHQMFGAAVHHSIISLSKTGLHKRICGPKRKGRSSVTGGKERVGVHQKA